MKFNHFLLLAGLVFIAPPALADTSIDQTHELSPDARLSVSNVKGAIIIHTWDKPRVHITGTLGANTPPLEVEGGKNHLTIKVKNNSGGGWFNWSGSSSMGPTRLELTVPKGVNLEVNVVSARVKADGLEGGKLDLDTVSGNLQVTADSPSVTINSVSGGVKLGGKAARLDVNTVSGDVRIERVGNQASAQTVSGDVQLSGGPLQKASVDTVSGDIDIAASLAPDTSTRLHSMSGDIRLRLEGKAGADLNAKSMSGDIRSAFGKAGKPTYGPGSRLHYKLGDGKGDITLESLSGDIDIRKGG